MYVQRNDINTMFVLLEGYEAAKLWISVDEELPEKSQKYHYESKHN